MTTVVAVLPITDAVAVPSDLKTVTVFFVELITTDAVAEFDDVTMVAVCGDENGITLAVVGVIKIEQSLVFIDA